MTLPRLREMTAYWVCNPPQHLSLSGIVGALGGKAKPKPQSTDEETYVPPEIDSTNDVTGLMAAPVFSDTFAVKKPRTIFIDNRNRKN